MVAVTALSLCSCTENEPPPRAPDTSAATSQHPSTVPAPPSVSRITLQPFNLTAIPARYTYAGQPVGGARWLDANGDNVLIVSMQFTQTDDLSRQEIFAYQYLTSGDSTRRLWMIHDQAENFCDKGDGLVSDIMIQDLNNDGVAENAFVYNVQGACDVSPRTYKLMLHSGTAKYAVRGNNTVLASSEPGTRPDGGEKIFDPAFDGAPSEFRMFAAAFWDQNVK